MLKKRNGIASESVDVAEDEQIFPVFAVADHKQRFSGFFFFFFAYFGIFFLRMFVGLKHAILICVYMDLQQRDGSEGGSELSIGDFLLPSLYH